MPRFTEILEHPIPENEDWYLRKMKHYQPVGSENFVWCVELANRASGVSVQFEHEHLYLAWVRAVEAAYSSYKGIFQDDAPPEGQSLS